jgi:hypothetical protein
MLHVVMLNVIILNVVMLSVVVPDLNHESLSALSIVLSLISKSRKYIKLKTREALLKGKAQFS